MQVINMLLTVDIGNTNIVLGGFLDSKLTFISRISTNARKTEVEYATKIKSVLSLYNVDRTEVTGAIVSSVVPPLTKVLVNAIKLVYNIDALVVGPGIKTGINLLADNPSQVGADLICACVAAYNLYEPPVLIIDMGTATKLLVVDEKACFGGAVIMPGVEISLKALSGGTAQLPQISLDAPNRVMGKNTVECMQSGVVFGNASMMDGMIDRIEAEEGKMASVVATGGLSKAIMPYCNHSIIQDDDLILKGLKIIYEKNKK